MYAYQLTNTIGYFARVLHFPHQNENLRNQKSKNWLNVTHKRSPLIQRLTVVQNFLLVRWRAWKWAWLALDPLTGSDKKWVFPFFSYSTVYHPGDSGCYQRKYFLHLAGSGKGTYQVGRHYKIIQTSQRLCSIISGASWNRCPCLINFIWTFSSRKFFDCLLPLSPVEYLPKRKTKRNHNQQENILYGRELYEL